MAWSDREFCERVARRCAELGRSQRQVLKAAGVAHDYLQTTPAHGRRIDTLEKVAQAIDWTLADVLGLSVSARLDGEVSLYAYHDTQQAAQVVQRIDEEDFCQIHGAFYNLYVSRLPGGQAIDDEYRTQLIQIFSEQLMVMSKMRRRQRSPGP